jgi:hypothetical protein
MSASNGFRYFRGYPFREWRHSLQNASYLTLLVVFALLAIYNVVTMPGLQSKLVQLLLFGLVLALLISVIRTDHRTSVVPYFDRRVGGIHSFGQGKHVAASCQRLDQLAMAIGVAPLSAFGFDDDYPWGRVRWHDPMDGVKTMDAVLSQLPTDGAKTPLRIELETIRDALVRAVEAGARFCLILHGPGTNAMEHDRRKGSFF